jgi:hypothetical protein
MVLGGRGVGPSQRLSGAEVLERSGIRASKVEANASRITGLCLVGLERKPLPKAYVPHGPTNVKGIFL